MGKTRVVGNINEYSARVLPYGKIQPIVFLMMLAPVVQNPLVFLVFWRRSKRPVDVKVSKTSSNVTARDDNSDTANNRRSSVPLSHRKAAEGVNARANANSSMSEDHAEEIERYRKELSTGMLKPSPSSA